VNGTGTGDGLHGASTDQPAWCFIPVGRTVEGMNPKASDVVSASEIASWAWCPEAWRLEALGEEPQNEEERARGTRFHARTAAAEKLSRRVARLGRWLLVLGLVAAAIGLVLYFVVSP
jgi:hypothetical protein